MLTKKTTKNQLTLPKGIVKEFPGIEYFDAVVEKRRIVLTPVRMIPVYESLDSIREKIPDAQIASKSIRKETLFTKGKKKQD